MAIDINIGDPTMVFRLMWEVLPQMDGWLPFRETQPALASRAAAPYINAPTQAMGDAVHDSSRTTQAFASVVAGTVRFVAAIPPVTVDLIGPIAEETPIQTLDRIPKTLLNGIFAMTTRSARYCKFGVPGRNTYEKGMAVVELTLAGLATAMGFESILRPRPPRTMPEPFMVGELAVAGAARAMPAVGLELPPLPKPPLWMMMSKAGEGTPRPRTGKAPKTGQELMDLYTRHGRSVSQLAQALEVSRAAVYQWFDKLGLKEVLRNVRKKAEARTLSRAPISDQQLAELYVEHRYNIAAVVDTTGYSPARVHQRIAAALKNKNWSDLKALIEVKRAIAPISDNHIQAVYRLHGFDLNRTSQFLGLSKTEILLRCRGLPSAYANALKRVQTPSLGNSIAVDYVRSGFNDAALATALEVPMEMLDATVRHIIAVDHHSLLGKLLEVRLGVRPTALSDTQIMAVMVTFSPDYAAAPAFLKMDPATFLFRARKPGSVLNHLQFLRFD